VWGTVLVRVPCVRRGTCVGVLCEDTGCVKGTVCVVGTVWGTVFVGVPCVRRGTCVWGVLCRGTVCTEGYVCEGTVCVEGTVWGYCVRILCVCVWVLCGYCVCGGTVGTGGYVCGGTCVG
jgi:hypothetical protein